MTETEKRKAKALSLLNAHWWNEERERIARWQRTPMTETEKWEVVKCPKCGSDQCFPTDTTPAFMCIPCGHEFDLRTDTEVKARECVYSDDGRPRHYLAIVERIARALADERENAAKIAEAEKLGGNQMLSGTRLAAVHDGACNAIAAAIRAREQKP